MLTCFLQVKILYKFVLWIKQTLQYNSLKFWDMFLCRAVKFFHFYRRRRIGPQFLIFLNIVKFKIWKPTFTRDYRRFFNSSICRNYFIQKFLLFITCRFWKGPNNCAISMWSDSNGCNQWNNGNGYNNSRCSMWPGIVIESERRNKCG